MQLQSGSGLGRADVSSSPNALAIAVILSRTSGGIGGRLDCSGLCCIDEPKESIGPSALRGRLKLKGRSNGLFRAEVSPLSAYRAWASKIESTVALSRPGTSIWTRF